MEDPSTKFVVPVHTADIELPTADRFCVQSVMDVGGASQEDLQAVLQGVCVSCPRTIAGTVLPPLLADTVLVPLLS